MIQTITYNEVLREAVLEKIIEQKKNSKKPIRPGKYVLPDQPPRTNYAFTNNNWYYIYYERIKNPGEAYTTWTQIVKQVDDKRLIKKLNRQAKHVDSFIGMEDEEIVQKSKAPSGTYIDPKTGEETFVATFNAPEVTVTRMDPLKAAKAIYRSKGRIWDDEQAAIAWMSNVANSQEYWRINKAFMDKVDPKSRTLVEYFRSYMSIADRCRLAWHLFHSLQKSDHPTVLKKLVTYGEIKKVAFWVYNNYPNSVSDQHGRGDDYIKDFKNIDISNLSTETEKKIMNLTWPGGSGVGNIGGGIGGPGFPTGAVNLKPDIYTTRINQSLKRWTPEAAKMVWLYLHDPALYLNEFKDDFESYDFRDFMSQAGAVVGASTYWTWDETIQYFRELAYSPAGITATVVLEVFPATVWIPKIVFGLLLADDLWKFYSGTNDEETVMNLIFDVLGLFHAPIIAGLRKYLKPLLSGLIGIVGRGFKMTAAGVKYLVQFMQRAAKPVIQALEKLGGGKLLSKIVQTFKSALRLIKDTIKDIPFLKSAAAYIDKALATIELYWVAMIKPFLETLSNVIKMVLRFPGQAVEFIMSKLGFSSESLATKGAKAGVKTLPVAAGLAWTLEHYAEWKAEYDFEKHTEAQQEAYLSAHTKLLSEHVVGIPNVDSLQSWTYDANVGELKEFGFWNNYEAQMSDINGMMIPMEMVLYDTIQAQDDKGQWGTYVKVRMPLDKDAIEIADVYVLRSEMHQFNKNPLTKLKKGNINEFSKKIRFAN